MCTQMRLASLAAALLLALAGPAAQGRRPARSISGASPTSTWNRYAALDDFDGTFQFCRLEFRNSSTGDGDGWGVDWPRADQNLSIRLSELTRTPVSMDATGTPNSLLLLATSPELSHCPFVMMTEPGGAYFDEDEAAALRSYLLKGGFLWADDFWGSYAWTHWEGEIRKVLPSGPFPIVDVPFEDPLFHQMMNTQKGLQIPGIGYWSRTGGTSERGPDSAVPHIRAIADAHGRYMVLMTHNSDYGDSYEREGDEGLRFQRLSSFAMRCRAFFRKASASRAMPTSPARSTCTTRRSSAAMSSRR
jgi:Domain of unknown function (DUF4159)